MSTQIFQSEEVTMDYDSVLLFLYREKLVQFVQLVLFQVKHLFFLQFACFCPKMKRIKIKYLYYTFNSNSVISPSLILSTLSVSSIFLNISNIFSQYSPRKSSAFPKSLSQT